MMSRLLAASQRCYSHPGALDGGQDRYIEIYPHKRSFQPMRWKPAPSPPTGPLEFFSTSFPSLSLFLSFSLSVFLSFFLSGFLNRTMIIMHTLIHIPTVDRLVASSTEVSTTEVLRDFFPFFLIGWH